MHTVSEIAATIIVWILLVIGMFFGLRAFLRKRRERLEKGDKG